LIQLNYKKLSDFTRTRSGVKELLLGLSKQKIQTVIFSNHNLPDISRQAKRLGIEKYIGEILANPEGQRDHVHRRHKAEKLHEFCVAHNFKPKNILCIGDTVEETQIGKHHGQFL